MYICNTYIVDNIYIVDDILYMFKGILLNHKKKEILSCLATWMDLEDITVSELSQKEEDEKKKKRKRKTNTI